MAPHSYRINLLPYLLFFCIAFFALKTKSYDEKFVIAQCTCINDGAILKYFELIPHYKRVKFRVSV